MPAAAFSLDECGVTDLQIWRDGYTAVEVDDGDMAVEVEDKEMAGVYCEICESVRNESDVEVAREGHIQHCAPPTTTCTVACCEDNGTVCHSILAEDPRPLKKKLAIQHAIRARTGKADPHRYHGPIDEGVTYASGEYDTSCEDAIRQLLMERWRCLVDGGNAEIYTDRFAALFQIDNSLTPLVFRRYASTIVESWEAPLCDDLMAVRTDWSQKMKKGGLIKARVKDDAGLVSYLAAYGMSGAWVWGAALPFGAQERTMVTWACLTTWLDHRDSADASEAPRRALFKRVSNTGVCDASRLMMLPGVAEGISACWRIECLRTPRMYAEAAAAPPLRHVDSILLERTREGAVTMQQSFARRVAVADPTDNDKDGGLQMCNAASRLELVQILVHDICDLGNDLNSKEPTNTVMMLAQAGYTLGGCTDLLLDAIYDNSSCVDTCLHSRIALQGLVGIITMQAVTYRYAGWLHTLRGTADGSKCTATLLPLRYAERAKSKSGGGSGIGCWECAMLRGYIDGNCPGGDVSTNAGRRHCIAALQSQSARALVHGERNWCASLATIMADDLTEVRSDEESLWRQQRLSEVFYGGCRRLGTVPQAQASAVSLACAIISVMGTQKGGMFGVECGAPADLKL